MKTAYSVSEAQAQLSKLLKDVAKGPVITIERHGEPTAYVIAPDRFHAILETMEILSDPRAMAALRQAKEHPEEAVPIDSVDWGLDEE